MKIILGSKSRWRKKVLEKAGYDFEVMTADIDEKAIRSSNYEELPLLVARAKSKKILKSISEPSLLITSDQIVVWNGQLREKPESEQEAREFLHSYGDYPAQTNTAVVVTNTQTGKGAEGVDIAKVFFKPISEEVIDMLIKEGAVMHAAGGYIVEHPLLMPFIDHIEGDIDSISGLPMKLTKRLMEEVSI